MKSGTLRRLEEVERKIRTWKEVVSEKEREVSEREESLSQLRKGVFAVFCLVSTCILSLIT